MEQFHPDDVVISGVGCSLPNIDNMEDLSNVLFGGVNPIQHDDSVVPVGYYGNYPEHMGHISDPWAFDCTFFGVSKVVARSMDPMVRKILERTFEALLDAGLNPTDLKGTNSAFYSGTTFSDYDLEWDTYFRGGYGIMGRNRCMNANRVSYWLDSHGTSVATDCNWADGIVNLELAWNAIKKGDCDIAVVNGASITIHNELMIQFRDMGVLCCDGKTKAFDDSADGYVRSAGVVVLVLQRASAAKRCYGVVEHAFAQTLGSPNGTYGMPSEKQWEDFLKCCYQKANINPRDICYYEANGSGVRHDDAAELNAAMKVLCQDRPTPLLIGSVKSNIGHTEAASALASVVKAIACLERQEAPANLHYSKPNKLVPGLLNGKMKVASENTALPPNGLVAVSSYGYGGVYGHVILRRNHIVRDKRVDSIPRLVFMADRMADTIEALLDKVDSMPYNEEYYSLLHDIHSKKLSKYLGRGYTILPKKEGTVMRETASYNDEKRPIWFVFSGMGSQWNGMGKALMALPLFRESIERSAQVLKSKNVDLISIITSDDPTVFDNILHAFVGIAAIQVALVDILNALEIIPDGIIGHSVGELGCSYADGGLTAEQMVLCAYYRGLASIESQLIPGFMAAIGKGYNQIKDELPPEIDVACHNSATSCTLSGPAEVVKEFVEKLKADKIFAKTVNVANIAYHSRYIEPVAPKLLAYLQKIITDPKPRSSKWVSTSNSEEELETDVAKFCSAEYHTKNLLNAVLFEEGALQIPANAICIEIAPHGLLQAILKPSLSEENIHIPLTRRTAEEPLLFLLQAIGKMYLAGMHPQVSNLYPAVEYPVSRNTPTLAQLVHWNFEHEFNPNFRVSKKVIHSIRQVLLQTSDNCVGCVIDNKSIYPASIYLRLAWDIAAMYTRKKTNEFSAVFRSFRLDKPFHFVTSDKSEVTIMINTGTRYLEMSTEGDVIGHMYVNTEPEPPLLVEVNEEVVLHVLGKEDVYQEFRRRGYEYSKAFETLEKVEISETLWRGYVSTKADWTQKFEAMLQLVLLYQGEQSQAILYPVSVGRAMLSPQEHLTAAEGLELMEVIYSVPHNAVKCVGMELSGIRFQQLEQPKSTLSFEMNQVVPYQYQLSLTANQFVEECIRIVGCNLSSKRKQENGGINVLRLQNDFYQLGAELPKLVSGLNVNVETVKVDHNGEINKIGKDVDLVIGGFGSVKNTGILFGGNNYVVLKTSSPGITIPPTLEVITKTRTNTGEELFLLKESTPFKKEDEYVTIPDRELVLINILNRPNAEKKTFYLIGYDEPAGGPENYMRHVEEATTVPIRWLFILDKDAPIFSKDNELYRKHLQKGLANNVWSNGSWGFFERKLFTEKIVDKELTAYSNLRKGGEVEADYIGINMTSNRTSAGQIVTDFSGRLRTGTRVMGLLSLNNNSMAHDPYLVWQVPANWSQEEAATVSLPFLLAYYSMDMVAKILPYENVLVTDGLSIYGQAAIAVAQKSAANVYATVGSEEEKVLLRELFPKIKENHILLHTRMDFNILLGLQVGKKGMPQVIFNTLEGESIEVALRCISSFGRVFHLGKEDIEKNRLIGLIVFVNYSTLFQISGHKLLKLSAEDKEILHGLMNEGIKDGTARPFSHIKFSQEKIIAHNSLTEKKQMKILFDVKMIKKDVNSLIIHPDNSYVIIGDKTDVWLDLAENLLSRGATNLIIISPSTHSSERTKRRIEFLTRRQMCNISIMDERKADARVVLHDVQKLGPLAAVFLIAMEKQDNGYYSKAMEIDKLWQDKNGHLVVISNGQGDLSRLCESRQNAGLATTNLIWGADDRLIGPHLDIITQLSGKEAVISVTDSIRSQSIVRNAGRALLDTLPTCLQDFSLLGASLNSGAELIEVATLGTTFLSASNLSPFIIIPGLHSDPIKLVQSFARRLRYPVFCAKLPNVGEQTIAVMASSVMQHVLALKRKKRSINVVGISWGCAVAIELTRQLEQIGKKVSVMLIDCPISPIQNGHLTSKTVEAVLLSLIGSGSNKVLDIPQQSWPAALSKTINSLNVDAETGRNIYQAATYVNQKIEALMRFNINSMRLKGPMVVLRSDQIADDFCYTKICSNAVVRDYPLSYADLLESASTADILHQAAVLDDMCGSENAHECTWVELEKFIEKERLAMANSANDKDTHFSYLKPVNMSQDEASAITL